jgi:3',5'-cyclic AMP phosphodiesterase CpdA
MRLAIIADPHVHDPSFDPRGDGSGAFRTLADTAASTRVFNESLAAFRHVLEEIATACIKLVVIVGDLTDDGELYARRAMLALTDHYASLHGMRFFATFGNHDLFALDGRHMAKRFARVAGGDDLVGSGPEAEFVHRAMYCPGYAETLASYGALGFMRQPADLYWESPFGPADDPASRRYGVLTSGDGIEVGMIDGSYLVEPVEGLWLLSIDANVYLPGPGGFRDCSEEGWGAAVRHKRFLLDWIASVTERAARLGKQLVAFSHYPAAGPFPGAAADEARLFGASRQARRPVAPEVCRALSAAGLRVHFSGHWHIGGILERDGLVNVAVPSLVAFPPAYQVLDVEPGGTTLRTLRVDRAPGWDVALATYARESEASLLASANGYLDFLDRHLALLVRDRYLPLEWPPELARLDLPGIPLVDFALDCYRLRKGGMLASDRVPPQRIAAYRALARDLAARELAPGSGEAALAAALRLLEACLAAPDIARYRLDLTLGAATSGAAISGAPSAAIPAPAGS